MSKIIELALAMDQAPSSSLRVAVCLLLCSVCCWPMTSHPSFVEVSHIPRVALLYASFPHTTFHHMCTCMPTSLFPPLATFIICPQVSHSPLALHKIQEFSQCNIVLLVFAMLLGTIQPSLDYVELMGTCFTSPPGTSCYHPVVAHPMTLLLFCLLSFVTLAS